MKSHTKFYAYADESGQDTRGALFVVAVAVVGTDREAIMAWLEAVERETGKGKVPWHKARREMRAAYIARVLEDGRLHGALFFSAHRDRVPPHYQALTLDAIAEALTVRSAAAPYRATVIVDGLRRQEVRAVGVELRRRRIPAKKVRGARDESHALVRLADALAGFVRDATEGQGDGPSILARATARGAIRRVGA